MKFSIPKIEAQIKGEETFKNIHEENELTWEDTARVLNQFISEELNMNYTHEERDMFISRAHRGSQDSAESHHKGPRTVFAQFTNWRFAEEVRTRIVNLTSKRSLSVYVTQMYSKELTERRNEALDNWLF